MGRNLHPSQLRFFHDKMHNHDRVEDYEAIPSDEEFLFEIRRTRGLPPVVVHLTDAYLYGTVDYASRPSEVDRGSFIVMGMPHADYDPPLVARAKRDGIGLGHIGKFMGALASRKVWEYESPAERAERLRNESP